MLYKKCIQQDILCCTVQFFSFLEGLGFSFQVTLNNESFDLENSIRTVDSFLRYL